MILRLLRPLFTADAMGTLLLIAALATLTSGVAASVPGINAQNTFLLCLAAGLIGFGLAKTHRRSYQAAAGIAAMGILLVWILGARLTQPLLVLFSESVSTLLQIYPALRTGASIDTTGLQAAWVVIHDASFTLWLRIQAWVQGFRSNLNVNDALVRNMMWILIHWLVSAWLGWFAKQRKALLACAPALAVLALVSSYSEKHAEYLLGLVIITFLLMGIWHYKIHLMQWVKTKVDYSESISMDMGQTVILITFAFGALAAVTPSISWQDVVEFIRERNDSEAGEMLGIQKPPASIQTAGAPQPSMPRDYLLTGGYANSEKIVMTIRTGELPPLPSEMLPAPVPRYYWRSVVYDQYEGTGWVTSATGKQSIPANTPLLPAVLSDYRLIHMDVQMVEPAGRLFWSGTLFSTDTDMTAQWRTRPSTDMFADRDTLLQADLFSAAITAQAYRVEAYIPTPSLSDLRAASSEYPPAVFERYLILPRSVPTRVRDLALDITKEANTPYDKANAIESYLRSNYPYDLNVPAPPPDQDVVDFFLFDLKKGYCDYYATAMVVLARANGLPARFVSGYSPGSYDAPNAQYIIRELNAHSWAEVYFPGIGWVEFEPTASLPEIEHTDTDLPLPPNSTDQTTAQGLLTRFRLERLFVWSAPFAVLLAVLLLYYTVIQRWWVLRLAPTYAIERIYQNFYRSGRILIGNWERSGTSSEYLQHITEIISTDKSIPKQTKQMALHQASVLTRIYQQSLFQDHVSIKQDALHAWEAWSHLRKQLFVIKIHFYLKNLKNFIDLKIFQNRSKLLE